MRYVFGHRCPSKSLQHHSKEDEAISKQDKYLNTDHLRDDLKGHTVRSGAVTIASQGVTFGLKMLQTIVLARLLLPEAFGLVAMVTAITGFIAMFKDAGLSMATVQKDQITHAQVSTLFWINIAISTVLVVVVICLAPIIAVIYNEPRLTMITIALAMPFWLTGAAIQHQAILKRQMRFTFLAFVNIGALGTGVTAAIAAAFVGGGYWALVILNVVQSFVTVILSWMFCGWRPGRPYRGVGTRSMIWFGGSLTASSFFNYLSRNVDNFLIGLIWGASPLGLYRVAYRFLLLPVQEINKPISQAMLPTLSRLQHEPSTYRRYYRLGLEGVVTIGLPIIAFAAVSAPDLILFILGPKWMDVVPIFEALVPAAIVGTQNVATAWIFIPLGQGTRQLKMMIFSSVVSVVSFFIGLPWGPLGIALAFSISVIVKRPVQLLYATHMAPVTMKDIGSALWRPVIAAIAGIIASNTAALFMASTSFVYRLATTGFIFIAVYGCIVFYLPGTLPWLYILKQLKLNHLQTICGKKNEKQLYSKELV